MILEIAISTSNWGIKNLFLKVEWIHTVDITYLSPMKGENSGAVVTVFLRFQCQCLCSARDGVIMLPPTAYGR